MYTCVVKDYKGSFADTERHTVKKVSDLICGHVLCRSESLISVPAVYHAGCIEPETSFRGDVDFFSTELPSVWHISICADMTLITIVKVYETVLLLLYEFLQLLALVGIELRRGSTLGRFLIRLYLAPMRIKSPEGTFARFLAGSLLPSFFRLLHALPVIPDGPAHRILVGTVYYIGFRPRPRRVSSP